MFPVTWRCHICGEERPDDKISVFRHDLSEKHENLKPGVVVQNIRYCNDKHSCMEQAAQGIIPEQRRPTFWGKVVHFLRTGYLK